MPLHHLSPTLAPPSRRKRPPKQRSSPPSSQSLCRTLYTPARAKARPRQASRLSRFSRDNLSQIFTRPLKTLAKIYFRMRRKAERTFSIERVSFLRGSPPGDDTRKRGSLSQSAVADSVDRPDRLEDAQARPADRARQPTLRVAAQSVATRNRHERTRKKSRVTYGLEGRTIDHCFVSFSDCFVSAAAT